MAAFGLLLGLREAGARLSELHARAAGLASGPVPRSLDWIAETERFQRMLAAMETPLLLAALAVGLAAAWRLARLLNPDGTRLVAEASEGGVLAGRLQTPLDAGRLRRVFAAAAITFYLVGGVRFLLYEGSPDAPPVAWGLMGLLPLFPRFPELGLAAVFALTGAALWGLWGDWGELLASERPFLAVGAHLGRGAIAGLIALCVGFSLTSVGRENLGASLAAVGITDHQAWWGAIRAWVLFLPLTFLLLGLAGHMLALGQAPRLNGFLAALGFLVFSLGVSAIPFRQSWLREPFDLGKDLATLIGARRQAASTRAYLIFPRPNRALAGFVPAMSIEGIEAGNDSPRKAWAYLEGCNYRTALAWSAFVHLHDCASLDWDSAQSLRVDLANLERHPQPIFAGLLTEKLATCATSARNHALLRQAADPGKFRTSPRWLRTLGVLHHRFGDRPAAEAALQKADVPEEEIATLLGAGLPLTAGRITGRLIVNGRPGARLTAGLLPSDRWSSLVGTPRPFEHRWVAAAAPTDAAGRFTVSDLGDGAYVLIVAGDSKAFPAHTAALHVESSAGEIRLDRRHPTHDLGTLRITLSDPGQTRISHR
jgi:hypothetical protein